MTHESSQALINTGISLAAASVTLTEVQPFISLLSSFTAIISGTFAIRYFYKATKKLEK